MFSSEKVGTSIAVFREEGMLNMLSAPTLRGRVQGAIAEGRSKIVVDLSSVAFMDSTGLGALIGCLKAARQAGGYFRIAAPSKQVAMVLKLANMERVLATFDTAEEAFAV